MRRHLSKNDTMKKKKKEEEDCVYDANNATNTKANDNYNDEGSNNSSNGVDDGEGYESWTEGNWCSVLPFPAAIDDDIETGPSTADDDNNDNNNDDNDNNNDDNNNDGDDDDDDDDDGDDCTQQLWMRMFQKLVEYKKQHINTMVPSCYDENPKLERWVASQRNIYSKDELNPNRVDLLNSVRFDWAGVQGRKIDNEKWMSVFQRLVEYKKQHRNTTVPRRYDEDPKLGRWIKTQRQNYKNDKLLPNRCALLNSIDFN